MSRKLHRTGMLFLLLSAAALSAPVGCGSGILISREEEIRMGEEAAPEFEKEFGGAVPNRTLQNYVTRVGMRVARVCDREMPYEFTLVRSDVPNAFALPGGKIFLTAGLMSRMDNERELSAVLGHEVGHVAKRHNVKQMEQQLGVSLLSQLAGTILSGEGGQAAEAVTKVVGTMVLLRYSREQEHEADLMGIQYMSRAGDNPYGMVELLSVLMNLSESQPSRVENWFQTHPLTSDRIELAREEIRDEHPEADPDAPDPRRDEFLRMRRLLLQEMGW